jgi:hypothetical protein
MNLLSSVERTQERDARQTHQKLSDARRVLCGRTLLTVPFSRASVLDYSSPLPLSVTGDIQSGRGLPQSKTCRGGRKSNLFQHDFDAFALRDVHFHFTWFAA